jgi:hypothetical protein
MSDETRDIDEYWRGIVEGLYEQIRDLEQHIRVMESELDEYARRESYDGSY